ncbi:MAG: Crp/Fnr family transcriptional regulator [Deltaproteobacteria bacterium]|nr:Crp/Fnr family transcriptional regulator [Deltaproteobacteria bacterium]
MRNVALSEQAKIEAFLKNSVLGGLPPETLTELAGLADSLLFEAGETLFIEGDPADHFFLVQRGQSKLFKTSRSGRNLTFTLATAGDAVNGLAMSLDHYYLTAQAITKLVVLRVDRKVYQGFQTRHPSIAIRLVAVLAQVMSREHERLLEVISENAEYRLIHFLRVLVRKFGPRISLTREELAEFVGLTTETTIRLFAQLKQRGIIAPSAERGSIVISDPQTLDEYRIL